MEDLKGFSERAKTERLRAQRISQIKAQMEALDFDINACEDGVIKAKTIEEYRRERIVLRNGLRVIEGKSPLITEGAKDV